MKTTCSENICNVCNTCMCHKEPEASQSHQLHVVLHLQPTKFTLIFVPIPLLADENSYSLRYHQINMTYISIHFQFSVAYMQISIYFRRFGHANQSLENQVGHFHWIVSSLIYNLHQNRQSEHHSQNNKTIRVLHQGSRGCGESRFLGGLCMFRQLGTHCKIMTT